MFALANIELRAKMGISCALQGRRPEDQGLQQISESRFIHEVNKVSYERNLRWWEERNVKARSEAML